MAINNYDWEGVEWVDLGSVDNVLGGQPGGRRANPEEYEAGGQLRHLRIPFSSSAPPTSTIRPSNEDNTSVTFGRFTFVYGPNGPGIDLENPFNGIYGGQIDHRVQFNFMKQAAAVNRGFSFVVQRVPTSLRFPDGIKLSIEGGFPSTIRREIVVIAPGTRSATTSVTDAPGMCFQIEWKTDPSDLGNDLGSPSLPFLTFVIRGSTVSANPDDVNMEICAQFDLDTISNIDPAAEFYSTDEVVEAVGVGARGAANTIFDSGTTVIFGSRFHDWFDLNRGAGGYVGQNIGSLGLINPQDGETISGTMVSGLCGWRWELVGSTSIP